jgi:hypothetical protein
MSHHVWLLIELEDGKCTDVIDVFSTKRRAREHRDKIGRPHLVIWCYEVNGGRTGNGL